MSESTTDAGLAGSIAEVARVVGRLVGNLGFDPKVGEAWVHLFLAGRPLTADEVAQAIDVDRVAARAHLRELRGLDAAVRLQEKGDLRDRFEASTDLWKVLQNVLRRREALLVDEAVDGLRKARDAVKAAAAAPSARLEKVQQDRVEKLLALALVGRTAIRQIATGEGAPASVLGKLRL
jgi:DNA-binding transcriptional regulator GbsR (MarR family)